MLGRGYRIMKGLLRRARCGAVGDMDQYLLVFFLGTLILGRMLLNSDLIFRVLGGFCKGFFGESDSYFAADFGGF